MQPVTCHQCGTEVAVEKFSWEHTNTQWQAPSATVCPVIRQRLADGRPASQASGCEHLEASIRDAVQRGTVTVEHPA